MKRVDPEVEEIVARAAARFAELGAIVEQADPPGGDPTSFFRVLYFSGAGFLLADLPEEKLALLDPNLRALVETSRGINRKEFQQATAERRGRASD